MTFDISAPLPPLTLRSHHPDSDYSITFSIPVVNGGMGVGVTGPTLAAAITNAGGGGVITGVVLGYPFQKLLGKYQDQKPFEANKLALRDWIRETKKKTNNRFVGLNIMVALQDFEGLARTAAEEGVDLIVAGAGLPMALPELTKNAPDTMIAPIISSVKAARVMTKRWMGRKRPPDAIIYESIHHSGGHQGASLDEIATGAHQPEEVVRGTRELLDKVGLEDVPVIVAGGIWTKEDIQEALSWGAGGVQMATRFVLTPEAGAEFGGAEAFQKHYLADDAISILERSPAGLPGRAVATPFSRKFSWELETVENEPHICPFACLSSCAKQDSIYCILDHLTQAVAGNEDEGLFFSGTNVNKPNRLKEIIPAAELMRRLAEGEPQS